MRALTALVGLALVGAVSARADGPEYKRGDEVRVQTVDGAIQRPPLSNGCWPCRGIGSTSTISAFRSMRRRSLLSRPSSCRRVAAGLRQCQRVTTSSSVSS